MTEQEQNGEADLVGQTTPVVPVVELLDDEPSDEDLAGGGHDRVARAIADIVKGKNGGKAIALEGSWGSGKSTIVNFLQEKCGDSVLVYTFDAWKHEGDPLRVAFLSGLARALRKKRWLKRTAHRKTERVFDQLRGKLHIETRTERALFRARDLLLISIVFVIVPLLLSDRVAGVRSLDDVRALLRQAPAYWLLLAIIVVVATAWVQRSIASLLLMLTEPKQRWMICPTLEVVAGLSMLAFGTFVLATHGPLTLAWVWVIASAALALAGATQLWLRDTSSWDPNRTKKKYPPWRTGIDIARGIQRPSFVEHLLRRQPHEVETEIRGSRSLGVEEFESRFVGLLERCIGTKSETETQHPDRRLILVLDNLDRLEAHEALAVWRTLRAFLELDSPSTLLDEPQRALVKQVWLLVPYDRTHMETLWPIDSQHADDAGTRGSGRDSSFLDKTFAVRLDVPPLRVLQWQEQLREALRHSLGIMGTPKALSEIERLFTHLTILWGRPPTLRQIKLFANDLRARQLQHAPRLTFAPRWPMPADMEFSIESLAAYELLRREGYTSEVIRSKLLNQEMHSIRELPMGWLTSDRQQMLACLVLNTWSRSDADEFLMAGRIVHALVSRQDIAFHSPDDDALFWATLHQSQNTIASSIVSNGLPVVTTAITSLAALSMAHPTHSKESIADLVELLITNATGWTLRADSQDLCNQAVQLCPRRKTIQVLAMQIQQLAQNTTTAEAGRHLGDAWGSLWSTIQPELKYNYLAIDGIPSLSEIQVPKERSGFVSCLNTLYGNWPDTISWWKRLWSASPKDTQESLYPTQNKEVSLQDLSRATCVAMHAPKLGVAWDAVAKDIAKYLKDSTGKDADAISSTLALLRCDCFDELYTDAPYTNDINDGIKHFRTMMMSLCDSGLLYERLIAVFNQNAHDAVGAIVLGLGAVRSLDFSVRQQTGQLPNKRELNALVDETSSISKYVDYIIQAPLIALRKFIQRRIDGQDGLNLLDAIVVGMTPDRLRQVFTPEEFIANWHKYVTNDSHLRVVRRAVLKALEPEDSSKPRRLSEVILRRPELPNAASVALAIANTTGSTPEVRALATRMVEAATGSEAEAWTKVLEAADKDQPAE